MRVSAASADRLRWYLRPLFWLQRKRYGTHLAPAAVWARAAPLYLALAGFNAALERRASPLEPALRSLVQARVSQINHCAFCIDLNSAHAAKRHGSMDKALAVADWRASDLFSGRERLALEYAEAMTVTTERVDDPLGARLLATFGEPAMIELTALIAFQNLSSKFNAALDIEAHGFCRMPER